MLTARRACGPHPPAFPGRVKSSIFMATTAPMRDHCRGQPGSAHGKPALVDRQNPVLATGPVCRRRVPGRSRKNAVPYGGPRVRILLPPASALTISYKAPLYDTCIPSLDGSRRPFSGEPEEIAGDIRSFAAIGVQELIFDCRGQSITESIERLQWFATDVTPLVDG
jgi:hypothetical protein